jgi:hypothetical protein
MDDMVIQDFTDPADPTRPDAIEDRLFLGMKLTAVVAVLISAVLAPWRVTTGIALGGGLALLNYHWLRNAISSLFMGGTSRSRFRTWGFLIRYFVIGGLIVLANFLRLVSLPATVAGMTVFVIPFMLEAGSQFYHAIFNREDG